MAIKSEIKKKSHESIYQQFRKFWQKIEWEKFEKGKLPGDIHVLWNFFIHDWQDKEMEKSLHDPSKPKLPKNIRKKFEEFSQTFVPDPEQNSYQVCISFLNDFKTQLPEDCRCAIDLFINWFMPDPQKNCYRLYHTYALKFTNNDDEGHVIYKFRGHNMMRKIEEFVKEFPSEGMKTIVCSDSLYSTSMILLVPLNASGECLGTAVVFIPQCTGENPIEFFLYSKPLEDLISALQSIQKLAKTDAIRFHNVLGDIVDTT